MLFMSVCSVMHACTMVVTILIHRLYKENERTIHWLVGHIAVIKSSVNPFNDSISLLS